jgi:exopolysaccharide biosynthesis polyprenyl glycosylphosphotransferase
MQLQEMELKLQRNRTKMAVTHHDWLKRGFDKIAACLGLLLLSPVFIMTAIAIKLEDPGAPVIYSQIRIGKNGKPFRMYKFRSMVRDADQQFEQLAALNEMSGAMFKMKNDPRVTRVGRWIRKTSIDELPQLWNVLRGEMSLVGPRPPLPRELVHYRDYDFQRLTVTPGCTGLWQVSGRSSIGFEEMVELDLQYIRRRSFWFDLLIILRTIRLLFGSRNAY